MSSTDEPGPRPPHRDRTGRLILFGAATSGLGLLSVLLGAAHLALPALSRRLGIEGADPVSAATGLALGILVGGVWIGLGVGSMRRRRWVPGLTQAAAWSWLLVGVALLAMCFGLIGDLWAIAEARSGAPPPPPEVRAAVASILLAAIALPGVLYPLLLLVIYRDRDLAETCRRADPPRPGERERPLAILVLAVALEAAALFNLPMLLRPVVPMFGRLWTGPSAAVALLAGVVVCAWLGERVWRRRAIGWWGTLVLSAVLGISTAWTAIEVEPGAWFRALGYPEADAQAFGASGAWTVWVLAATAALGASGVVYLLRIRRLFR